MRRFDDRDQTTWCSMAWTHQFIDPQGRAKPCCRFKMPEGSEDHQNLSEADIGNLFQGEFMAGIRAKMLANEPVSGCQRCYEEEASGKRSLRQRYNQMPDLHPENLIDEAETPKLRWLELAISNDCNLACRMCDSRYSHRWFKDEKEFFGKTYSKTERTKADLSSIEPYINDLIHVKFTGGEPLLIPDHFRLLDALAARDDASTIHLNYSTNLTIEPKAKTIAQWKRFRYVEFALSFDGPGAIWDYVRYPSVWKTAESVTQSFMRLTHEFDARIGLRSTFSVYNILAMPETFDWWIDAWNQHASTAFNGEKNWINPTHLTYPSYLSATVLPERYKDRVATKLRRRISDFDGKVAKSLEHAINYMYGADNSHLMPQLKSYTQHFDRKRSQNLFSIWPEFEGLFDDVEG